MTTLPQPGTAGADAGAARMQQIAAAAWTANQQRAGELTGLAQAAVSCGGLDPQEQLRGRELTHQLIGSAGTFGHDHVSELAREANRLLNAPEPSEADRVRLRDLASTIESELQAPPVLDW